MGDLAVMCQLDEMGDLAVGCYEDGGALPLCDAVHHDRLTVSQITITLKPKTFSVILVILKILIQNAMIQ
jgi:hypothetical protein